MPYCPDCGHDLRGRTPGRPCPECGVPVRHPLDAPPPTSAGPARAALLGVLATPLATSGLVTWGGFDGRATFILLTVGAWFGLLVMAWRERRWMRTRAHTHAIVLTGLAITPSALLVLGFLAMITGDRSLAKAAAMLAFHVGPFAGLAALLALVLPPYRLRTVTSFAMPIAAAMAAFTTGAIAAVVGYVL